MAHKALARARNRQFVWLVGGVRLSINHHFQHLGGIPPPIGPLDDLLQQISVAAPEVGR